MLLESLVREVPEVTTVEVSIASGSEECSGTSCSETASLMPSSSSSLANEEEDIPFFRLAVFSSDGDWARPNICRNDAMYSLARNIIFSWGIRLINGMTILQARGPSVFFRLRDKLHVTLPLGLLFVSVAGHRPLSLWLLEIVQDTWKKKKRIRLNPTHNTPRARFPLRLHLATVKN